jgi:hypothetical protein
MTDSRRARLSAAVAVIVALGAASPAVAADVILAPHRAVYDLKLARSQGNKVETVRGRILYDFTGNACEGYALQFRQVSELNSGEGKVIVSDLRATTWEDGHAKSFRFASQNFLNQSAVDQVDGTAERREDGLAVKLKKPQDKSFTLDAQMVLPSEHMRRAIEAARAGKTLMELPVYDGSDTGEKVYNTMTIIGREIDRAAKPLTDASAKVPALASMRRWPTTISYFDRKKTDGEQTPAYSIGFEMFENGISRALVLDYGDFVLAGEMTQLELGDVKPCK